MTARWPRLMKRKTAAEYCDMSVPTFLKQVEECRLPPPVMLGSRDHWDRQMLDKSIHALAGEYIPEHERKFWENDDEAA